jgi:hypothetical protein
MQMYTCRAYPSWVTRLDAQQAQWCALEGSHSCPGNYGACWTSTWVWEHSALRFCTPGATLCVGLWVEPLGCTCMTGYTDSDSVCTRAAVAQTCNIRFLTGDTTQSLCMLGDYIYCDSHGLAMQVIHLHLLCRPAEPLPRRDKYWKHLPPIRRVTVSQLWSSHFILHW